MPRRSPVRGAKACAWLAAWLVVPAGGVLAAGAPSAGSLPQVSVGPQYDSTHVYLRSADYDAFVHSFIATFGGKASERLTTTVTPVPSSTQFQYLMTPVGTLSTFAFQTPVPYPFGLERTGWLVTDMDVALQAARRAGAAVVVEKFKDPIGYDAVIEWPGGVRMQLYWHFSPPSYPPLVSVPENRIYLSPDSLQDFLRSFMPFAHGHILADDARADAGEIGRVGQLYRRLRIDCGFGRLQLMVTDGHLPYPFGHEITGYEVADLDATLARAQGSGAQVLSARYDSPDRSSAVVQFPGGYVAEIHAARR
jgi:predicted enzyme related to lactoylglutathione lyase